MPRKKLQLAFENAAKEAGIIPWPQNGLRHSFCSYAVASKGFEWTSLQADHSIQMLRKHYWEVVSKEEAERYWSIVPPEIVRITNRETNGGYIICVHAAL
jgi:hypothetical protein